MDSVIKNNKMRNEAIIKSIKILLEAFIANKAEDNEVDNGSLSYLLGQLIRQYDIPKEHRHISKNAQARWDSLNVTKGNIEDYHYRNKVTCNPSKPLCVKLYTGAKKEGNEVEITKERSFFFREMFHEDHVIPVSLIKEKLVELNPNNEKEIKELLEKMHICVILKDEDRKLSRTKGRSLDFEKTINDIYSDAGIYLKE